MATVDSQIHLDGTRLPEEAVQEIFRRLTIDNPEKEKAKRENAPGWKKLPDEIDLWEANGDELSVPRGFAFELVEVLGQHEIELKWDDHRKMPRGFLIGTPIDLYPEQKKIVETILELEQGILKAPTGCVSGDTIIHLNRAGKGFKTTIEKAYKKFNGLKSMGPNWSEDIPTYCRALVDDVFRQHLVEDIVESGIKETIEIVLGSGKSIRCTEDHRILTDEGWSRAGDLREDDWIVVNGIKKGAKYVPSPEGHHRAIMVGHRSAPKFGYVLESVLVAEEKYGRKIFRTEHVHHLDENPLNNNPSNIEVLTPGEHNMTHRRFRNMDGGVAGKGGEIVFLPKVEQVKSIRKADPCMTYDMVMQDPHNNFVANGIVVHNSGKTVSMLEIFRCVPGPGIVIVNTKEIAAQWISRCRKFLGSDYPVSMIGDGKFEIAERGLTVAIQATLWSRREKLAEEGFFERFVKVALDECHHATAATYNDIFARFNAKVRIGASATPEKTGEFRLAEVVIGPIVVEVTEEDIGEGITKPVIEVIETKLGAKAKGEKANKWTKSRSFNFLVKKLVADQERIELVANEILINHTNNANIVLSKRIAHLEAIYDALLSGGFPEDQLLAMIGNHSLEEREEAIELTEHASCVLLTTLADEALDAPRLDRCHLVFPTKNPELVIQQIGRVRRLHPDKVDSIVLDYCDPQIGMFLSQYMTRRHEVYNPRGFQVIKRKVSNPHDRIQ